MAETGGEDSQPARSFGAIADDYDRFRLRPPAEAVAWFLPARVEVALDLGAGTGVLSRRLLERADQVIAVEPDARMRAVIAQRTPDVRALEGTAERIPLADAAADAVIVSSAWHWMDPTRAIPEIARVLRPGGVFGILWTTIDHETDLGAVLWRPVRALDAARLSDDRHHPDSIWLPDDAPFDLPEITTLKWTWPATIAEVTGLLATYSPVIALSDEERSVLLAGVATDPAVRSATARGGTLDVPAVSRCWKTVRL